MNPVSLPYQIMAATALEAFWLTPMVVLEHWSKAMDRAMEEVMGGALAA